MLDTGVLVCGCDVVHARKYVAIWRHVIKAHWVLVEEQHRLPTHLDLSSRFKTIVNMKVTIALTAFAAAASATATLKPRQDGHNDKPCKKRPDVLSVRYLL
jgi:hypothetical protein